MKAYLAYFKSNLQLTVRDRLVLFFNYLMPLIFFIAFGEGMGAATSSGAMAQVVTMVLMLGVLGTGFFGGGMRATAEREAGILRRFKVAPITPAPILVSSLITGWIVFLPTILFFLVIARLRYNMPLPTHSLSLIVMVSAGVLAFRGIGLIIASVVNSMAESQVVIQLLYLPMLMLSGATIPLNILPDWLQSVAQFLPSTHLYLGMQNILVREQSLAQNLVPLGALIATTLIALLLSVKLFRWEKDDKLRPGAKLWLLGVLAPFVALGMWQAHSKDNLKETQILAREMRRGQSWLIKDARIFVGDGRVIERGSVLVKSGRIEAIFEGTAPDAKELKAETLEASGKTLLPGLIDTGVNLFLPGTGAPDPDGAKQLAAMERALGAYLYCGVTAVRTQIDPMKISAQLQRRTRSGEISGAELFLAGTPPLDRKSLVLLDVARGQNDLLKDTLTQQVLRPADLEKLRAWAAARKAPPGSAMELPRPSPGPMATMSGLPGIPHGSAIHRELKLWVAAGVSPRDALLNATSRAAQSIGAADRLGTIRPGADATLLIVEGNPLEDITVTERIWNVIFKGERVRRDDLLEEKN